MKLKNTYKNNKGTIAALALGAVTFGYGVYKALIGRNSDEVVDSDEDCEVYEEDSEVEQEETVEESSDEAE